MMAADWQWKEGVLMKNISVWIISALYIATLNVAWANDGETIFKNSGCMSCHKPQSNSNKTPSLTDISRAYQGKEEQLTKYLRGEAEPIMKPEKGMLMKRQIEKTRGLPDAELKNLVGYMLQGH